MISITGYDTITIYGVSVSFESIISAHTVVTWYHAQPFTVAEARYNGIDSIETTVKVNPFIEIQAGAHEVYDNPHEPLLGIFPCHHPHAHD